VIGEAVGLLSVGWNMVDATRDGQLLKSCYVPLKNFTNFRVHVCTSLD
jgi:hypothetical protein